MVTKMTKMVTSNKRRPSIRGHRVCYNCKDSRPSAEFFSNDKEYKVCHSCLLTDMGGNNSRKSYNKYGLSYVDYQFMLIDQENRCKICQRDFDNLDRLPHVDHDHETGVVRGLLCHVCNRGLGLLGDDVERLRAAVAYLEKDDEDGYLQ
jgi:recombination endonuclease VII